MYWKFKVFYWRKTSPGLAVGAVSIVEDDPPWRTIGRSYELKLWKFLVHVGLPSRKSQRWRFWSWPNRGADV